MKYGGPPPVRVTHVWESDSPAPLVCVLPQVLDASVRAGGRIALPGKARIAVSRWWRARRASGFPRQDVGDHGGTGASDVLHERDLRPGHLRRPGPAREL